MKINNNISLIVAATENNAIGKNNQLIWHLPNDMRYFREKTLGKPIIMGRKTFESIGRALPQRQNIVITHDVHFSHPLVQRAGSLLEAIQLAENTEIMIIGGASIYQAALPLANKIYLTRVHTILDGDAFFPTLDPTEWYLAQEDCHTHDDKHLYDYTFQIFKRR